MIQTLLAVKNKYKDIDRLALFVFYQNRNDFSLINKVYEWLSELSGKLIINNRVYD